MLWIECELYIMHMISRLWPNRNDKIIADTLIPTLWYHISRDVLALAINILSNHIGDIVMWWDQRYLQPNISWIKDHYFLIRNKITTMLLYTQQYTKLSVTFKPLMLTWRRLYVTFTMPHEVTLSLLPQKKTMLLQKVQMPCAMTLHLILGPLVT